MIAIVDYGMGNLGSLLNMFKRIEVPARIVSDPAALSDAIKLVLPGVGAFDAAMARINQLPGLRQVLDRKALQERVPVLGVCLGMQLLTESSEEGALAGLGWIPGAARRFPRVEGLKVPHMGWNVAVPVRDVALTNDLDPDARYYFVHSYFVRVNLPEHALMKTHYGLDFDSAIGHDNIMGVQFHPEKSHKFGMKILQNFAGL